jgi:riboflavin synthase
MFTGIVQARGRVASLTRNAFGIRLVIDPRGWPPSDTTLKHGDSICVSGVCLTLVQSDGQGLHFDVIAETLAKTTLGSLAAGSEVNLEPSLTPSSQLGGHFMQGHVDGVGAVTGITSSERECRITITPPPDLLDYIVPKGSIAVDGVSLTIAAASREAFEVALIPTTLDLTTLGFLKPGDRTNIESDILAKTVVHFLRRREAIR